MVNRRFCVQFSNTVNLEENFQFNYFLTLQFDIGRHSMYS